MTITREEFDSLIAEVESFRDLVLEELSKLRNDLEKINTSLEILEENLKDNNIKLTSRLT